MELVEHNGVHYAALIPSRLGHAIAKAFSLKPPQPLFTPVLLTPELRRAFKAQQKMRKHGLQSIQRKEVTLRST